MIGRIDPEEVETRVIHDLIDFVGKDVLEIGCGEGRMTWRFADVAASGACLRPRRFCHRHGPQTDSGRPQGQAILSCCKYHEYRIGPRGL